MRTLHHSDPIFFFFNKNRRLGSPGQDQQTQTQTQTPAQSLHRPHHHNHNHHYDAHPLSRSPRPTRNLITVFTHRSPRNANNNTNTTNKPNTSPTSIHHQQRPGTSSRAGASTTSRPSASDYSPPSPIDSHPLTPLSSTSTSNYSISDRKSSLTTPFSSTDSAPRTAFVSTSHSPSPPISNLSPSTRSKAKFKMPFRDRVARKFGETVSFGSISDSVQVQHHGFITMPSAFNPGQIKSTSFCASPTPFRFVDHAADILPSAYHKSDPRLGPVSGRGGLSCARPRIAFRHDPAYARVLYNEAEAGEGEDGKFLRKALGQRGNRVVKPTVKNKTQTMMSTTRNRRPQGTTGSSTGVVQGPSTRSSSRSTRSSSSSSTTSTRSSTLSSVYNNGRRLGARVTRASAKMVDTNGKSLTDHNGKQLSPTSPYLSCEYPRLRADLVLSCNDILLIMPALIDYDVCCM